MWARIHHDDPPKTPWERLRREAEEEQRQADQLFQGCCFYGKHPGIAHQQRAADLLMLANRLEAECKKSQ